MRKIAISLIIFLFLSCFVVALPTTDSTGESLSSTAGSITSKRGLQILTKENVVTLTKVGKPSAETATKVSLMDNSNNILATSTFVGNEASFNYSLNPSTYYRVGVHSDGASYVLAFTSSANFPYDRTNLQFVASFDTNSGTYTTQVEAIANITTDNDASSSISVLTNSFGGYAINFTSDGGQVCGYNTSGSYKTCGPTEDGTPTIRFNTSGSASCKLWSEAKNWTTLNNQGVPDCSTIGETSYVCTLSQPLPNGTQPLYISCKKDSSEISNFNSYPANILNISIASPISDSPSLANEAIEFGITNSQIWPGALIYTTQPVYIRTKEDHQAIATFDKVAIYGNQRWAFNYRIENESSIGTFYNISPVFYFWERANLSYLNVAQSVSGLINSTKI